MEGQPPGDADHRNRPAGSPRPHQPRLGATDRAAETWTPASWDRPPEEGQRLTPDAPRSGGRPLPRGRPPTTPAALSPQQGMQAKGTVLGPHARAPAPTARGWRTPTARPEDGQQGEGERSTLDAPRIGAGHPPGTLSRLTTRATPATGGAPNAPTSTQTPGGARGATLGAGSQSQHLSSPTNTSPHPQHVHQPREIGTLSPALRYSDTTMAEPAAPCKTRPPSPTLDAAHDVIRALGLRGGDVDSPQEDADADSDLEMIPGPPGGSAPTEPTPPAGSVPALCPAWKRGHCGGGDWCPRQHPRPGKHTHASRRPDGRVRARRVPSPCRLRTAAVRMDECAPGGYPAPAGYEHPPSGWTSEGPAETPRTATQHTERAHR